MNACEKIYSTIDDVPPKRDGVVRVLTGGVFDGIRDIHPGHKAFLTTLTDPFVNRHLLDKNNSDDLNQLGQKAFCGSHELLVSVVEDEELIRKDRLCRPIVPIHERMRRIAQIPGVTGVFPYSGNLKDASEIVKPDVVGFSLTTTGFNEPYHTAVRNGVRALGILAITLSQLVPISTTETVGDFFLGSRYIRQLNIPFAENKKQFPLLYAKDLVLTPDLSSVGIAQLVVSRLSQRQNMRSLELGVGSGIFTCSLLLRSKSNEFAHVVCGDIDDIALGIAEFNLKRTKLFLGGVLPPTRMILSDWFGNIQGKYDLIYGNPPFFTMRTPPPDGYEQNPQDSLYAPSPEFYYEQIVRGLVDHINTGGMVVLRVPRSEEKVKLIKSTLANEINLETTLMEDVCVGIGRYILLEFT